MHGGKDLAGLTRWFAFGQGVQCCLHILRQHSGLPLIELYVSALMATAASFDMCEPRHAEIIGSRV